MNHQNLRVLIADDHPAVCAGVRHALSEFSNVDVTCASGVDGSFQQASEVAAYDVLVCEFSTLGKLSDDATPFLDVLRRRCPELRIVVLTRLENAGVMHLLLTWGVQCVVSKQDELSHVKPAILRACSGGRYLSPRIEALVTTAGYGRTGLLALTLREMEVIRLFLSGMTVNEIALRLARSKKTISTQKGTAMIKLGLESNIELMRYGIEIGLVDT